MSRFTDTVSTCTQRIATRIRIASLTLVCLLSGTSLASVASPARASCSAANAAASNSNPAADVNDTVAKICTENGLPDADAISLNADTGLALDALPIPQPENYALLIAGLSGMALVAYRRLRRR